MLPFVMKELVIMLMEKKSLDLNDALYYIYSSKLYQTLLNDDTKTWYLSTLSIYDLLEKEKSERRKRKSDPKILFFMMFCLENLKLRENLSAEDTLLLFTKYDVFTFLESTFEMLHTQDSNYILDSILVYIKKKKAE